MVSKKTKTIKKSTVKKVVKKSTKKIAKKLLVKKKVLVKKTKKNKVSIKKITKKTSTKKQKGNKKELVVAVGDQCFWINEGPSIQNLIELRNALSEINKAQFIHHVNGVKNDFGIWVEEVLCDKNCADNIRKSRTTQMMIKNIEKALLKYYY